MEEDNNPEMAGAQLRALKENIKKTDEINKNNHTDLENKINQKQFILKVKSRDLANTKINTKKSKLLIEELQKEIAEKHGIVLTNHVMHLYGYKKK